MNKYFAMLILVGVGFFGYFAWKLADKGHLIPSSFGDVSPVHTLPQDSLLSDSTPITLARNPFVPPAKLTVVKPPMIARIKIDSTPPPFQIDAILPGANPVAILRKDANTIVARPGDNVWNARIISISGDAVTVLYKDVTHTLRRK